MSDSKNGKGAEMAEEALKQAEREHDPVRESIKSAQKSVEPPRKKLMQEGDAPSTTDGAASRTAMASLVFACLMFQLRKLGIR